MKTPLLFLLLVSSVTLRNGHRRGARRAQVVKTSPASPARITEFVTEGGTVFRAKMFIDATYEGDLMAKAGVTYTLIREANAQYGEIYNGIHYSEKFAPRTRYLQPGPNGRLKGGQGVWDRDFPLDPYVVEGRTQKRTAPAHLGRSSRHAWRSCPRGAGVLLSPLPEHGEGSERRSTTTHRVHLESTASLISRG